MLPGRIRLQAAQDLLLSLPTNKFSRSGRGVSHVSEKSRFIVRSRLLGDEEFDFSKFNNDLNNSNENN